MTSPHETNPAVQLLRSLAEAGMTDTFPCPCRAQGQVTEVEPMLFVLAYEHDDWCPKLARPIRDA